MINGKNKALKIGEGNKTPTFPHIHKHLHTGPESSGGHIIKHFCDWALIFDKGFVGVRVISRGTFKIQVLGWSYVRT